MKTAHRYNASSIQFNSVLWLNELIEAIPIGNFHCMKCASMTGHLVARTVLMIMLVTSFLMFLKCYYESNECSLAFYRRYQMWWQSKKFAPVQLADPGRPFTGRQITCSIEQRKLGNLRWDGYDVQLCIFQTWDFLLVDKHLFQQMKLRLLVSRYRVARW